MKFSSKDLSEISDVTILVNSSDTYSDVMPLFHKAFDEYWPNNKWKLEINYESNPILGYSEHEKKNTTWGKRYLDILKKIDTEFVLVLFDDFILESEVIQEKILSALDVLKQDPNGCVFYLNAASIREHHDDPDEDYRLLIEHSNYKVNSVPSIWRRKNLIKFTSNLDSPWSWEVFGTVRTWDSGLNFYSMSSQSNNLFSYDFSRGGAIYRGKWVRSVVEDKLSKYDLDLDINDRGFVTKTETVKRPLSWKINFLFIGFKSLKMKMFKFLIKELREKFQSP